MALVVCWKFEVGYGLENLLGLTKQPWSTKELGGLTRLIDMLIEYEVSSFST